MKKAIFHHTALCKGYVSVKCQNGIKEPYNGRFGKGYTIIRIIKLIGRTNTRYIPTSCVFLYLLSKINPVI